MSESTGVDNGKGLGAWWRGLRDRYQSVVEEYGMAALGTYLTIFFATLTGFWVAMRYGFEVSGTTANAGTIGAAYFATQLTKPIRLGATAVLTPAMVRVARRVRGAPALPGPPGER